MEIIKNKTFIIIFILCFSLLIAQNVIKQVSFDKPIKKVHQSDNYIAVALGNDSSWRYDIEVYNMKGQKLFSVKKSSPHTAEIINETNSFIVKTYSKRKKYGLNNNLVSFSLTSGKIKWKKSFYFGSIEISPNKKHLITSRNVDPSEGEKGKFKIIDLKSGEELYFPKEIWSYRAGYINSNLVFIMTEKDTILEPNPKYLENKKEFEKIKIKYDSLIYKYNHNKKDLTRSEFEIKLNKIQDKYRRAKTELVRTDRNETEISKFIVYNITSKNIISSGYLKSMEGNLIKSNNISKYFTDGKESIYLVTSDNLINYKVTNNNFNIIWDTKLSSEYSNIKPIYIDGDLKIISYYNGQKFLIDKSTGNSKSITEQKYLEIKRTSKDDPKIKIDGNTNTIQFLGGTNEN